MSLDTDTWNHHVHDPYVASADIMFGYFLIFPESLASTGTNRGSPKKGAIHRLLCELLRTKGYRLQQQKHPGQSQAECGL